MVILTNIYLILKLIFVNLLGKRGVVYRGLTELSYIECKIFKREGL